MSVIKTGEDEDEDSDSVDKDGLDRPAVVTPMEMDTRVSDAELIIAPPLDPPVVLMLHQWLTESADGTVEKVIPSISGDTILIVHLSEAIPLWRMMSELPFIADMRSDPYAESAEAMTKRDRSLRRFRFALKAV